MARLMLPVVLGCLPVVSRSEEPEDARAKAVRLTSEGAAAYKAEEYAKAIDRFDAAYRLYPAAPLLLNLSRAELKLSRCAEALRHAEMFKAGVPGEQSLTPDSPDAWLATVQRSCIEAVVHSSPEGATIFIDGERQTSPDSTPWKGRLTVGSHKVLLWRDGYEKATGSLDVSAGSPTSLELTLVPAAPPAAAVAAAPPRDSDVAPSAPQAAVPKPPPPTISAPAAAPAPQASASPAPIRLLPPLQTTPGEETAKKISNPTVRNVGYAGIAIGGAALIAAVVLGVTVQENTLAIGQRTGQRSTAQANADLSTSQAEATGADALYVIGGVLAAAGVPLAVVF
jgi:hypothetical protein